MTERKTIVLATKNKHKLAELQAVLANAGFDLRSAFEFADLQEVVEDGDTLEANALKKARYTFEMTGLPSLADDTGLEVDALGGAPGVYSARYAGENATYAQNVERLMFDLDRHERRQFQTVIRSARFRTVIAMVSDEGEHVFEGVCEGQITRNLRGEGGFGYDPVFLPKGHQQTFAEMDSTTKNAISHRGRAVQALLDFLT
ncbi:MAG: RdgB/HAM1 family non-canonical purine NTP pyrophosphatase [Balneolales bacterium]|nr:RdgB/HAM1 family non-canonical purine NTP pyrophosphatase [Balneolales bacterium]